jgi:hypothetical protein
MSHEALAGVRGDRGLDAIAGLDARGLGFGHFRVDPHGAEPVDAEEHRARHHRHALARAQLRDHAVDRGEQRHAWPRLAVGFDGGDRLRRHAEQHQALARGVAQLRVRLRAALEGEVFLLRGHPVGREQLGERLALGDRIERRAHEQALDVARDARLHEGDAALVEGDRADRLQLRREDAARGERRSHAEVLGHARADLHRRFVRLLIAIDRHELHVHEG